MKRLTVLMGLVAAMASVESFALGVETLTIQNDGNRHVWCAFTQYDFPGNKWATYSWWKVENGASGEFRNVKFFRCEEENNPEFYWAFGSSVRDFCAVRGPRHISPYHKSDDHQQCMNWGGEWRQFGELPDRQTYTIYLNP